MDKEALLRELKRRSSLRKLFTEYWSECDSSKPLGPENHGAYEWQREYHSAGRMHQERMLIAANRVGKTMTAAAEVAIHTTGRYPPWWKGRVFNGPTTWWTGAESSEQSRDVVQAALLGPEGSHGTGWIPAENIASVAYRQAGIPHVVDQVYVRHVNGGLSVVGMKSYEQKRPKWQGAALDGCWLDEEAPQDIFSEAMTRLLDKKGLMMVTFTPLYGQTELVRHFLQSTVPGIYVKNVTWDQAPHLGAEDKERLWRSYPSHERKTRSLGVPMMGTGAVFDVSEEEISVPPFEIPDWFYRINGVDFGIDHPAAGAFCAIDRDSDTFYVYDCYKAAGETPVYHASAMKKAGDWIPVAWPHDGIADKGHSGKPLKDQYRSHGLAMLREHAHYHDDRGTSREPGIIEMLEYMRTGRFKVFSNCALWFEEKRMYHRKGDKIIDKNDDIISATRYAFTMRRYARVKAMPLISRATPVPKLGQRHWRNS